MENASEFAIMRSLNVIKLKNNYHIIYETNYLKNFESFYL